jgi:hypothetical protein
VWLLLTIAIVVLGSLVPLLFKPDYYFVGDSEISYFGRFHHLGMELRSGHWPLLNPGVWRAGDYTVESSWGLFSPLSMALGLLASTASSALVFMTLYKVVFLAVFAAGTHVLARSLGVGPPLAAVAGVLVPFSGFTMYADAPSWAIGLMTASLTPWFWAGVRRMSAGGNPLLALVPGFLIVSLGYVSATIMLALLMLGFLIEAARHRDWRGLARLAGVGAGLALLVVAVHVPGFLSAGVTARSDMSIRNNGALVADVRGLLSSILPTAMSPARGSLGEVLTVPIMYLAWLLPLATCIDWSRWRCAARGTFVLHYLLVVSALWVLGPSNLGPVRNPMRMTPFLALAVVLVVVVLLDRARVARPSQGRLVGMLGLIGLATYLSAAHRPDQWHAAFVGGVFVAAGLLVLWWLVRAAREPHAPALACLFAIAWTVVLVTVQHHYYPRAPAADYNMPTQTADYQQQLPGAVGDVFVVGNSTPVLTSRPAANDHLLLANSWYVNPHRVQNVYSAIGYGAYNKRYCVKFRGTTCPEALETLFSTEPTTGLARVDLLSVGTVAVLRNALSATGAGGPPAGWHVAGETPVDVLWVRDHPVPPAGGVVWTSPGTEVEVVARDTRGVRLRVGSVPEGGGTVVLSRLDWPGYRVSNADLADPVDGYLLTLDVPADSAGKSVTVEFRPPGWTIEVAAAGIALLGGLIWGIMSLVLARTRRRVRPSAPEEPADV